MADPIPSSPGPESAPAPAPSEPIKQALEVIDERATPGTDMWSRMRDQIGGGPREDDAPGATPRPTREAPPAAPAPKKWGGRYDTPEALEEAYQEGERARSRAETERQRAEDAANRLERLLQASWRDREAQGQLPRDARGRQQMPPELGEALDAVRNELQLLAVGDPQGDVLRMVRAVAWASQQDEASRRAYADVALSEFDSRQSQANEVEALRTAFYDQHPDLKPIRQSLLRQVALETERHMRATRSDYGSPAFVRDWFAETARVARAEFRLSDGSGAPPNGSASPARPSTPATASRTARGAAPFSESPSSRSAEPVTTGQDAYLARVFGPRG